MQVSIDLAQKILNQVIESIFPKDLEPDVGTKEQFFHNFTDEESIVLKVERKLSEFSSGFEDFSDKIVLEDVDLRILTPENQISPSYEEIFNETIERSIRKFELQEKFKEAFTQTSPVRSDRECQSDLIFKLTGSPPKKIKTENLVDCRGLHLAMEVTTQAGSIRSGRTEICEKMRSTKQKPRIRVGLSKRARRQPFPTKIII